MARKFRIEITKDGNSELFWHDGQELEIIKNPSILPFHERRESLELIKRTIETMEKWEHNKWEITRLN